MFECKLYGDSLIMYLKTSRFMYADGFPYLSNDKHADTYLIIGKCSKI